MIEINTNEELNTIEVVNFPDWENNPMQKMENRSKEI